MRKLLSALDAFMQGHRRCGCRMVAYKDGTAVRLVSRAGKEHSRRFAEITASPRDAHPMAPP